MIGKYPDIIAIKKHPAHKDLTLNSRYSKKLFAGFQTKKLSSRQLFSNSVIAGPSKMNTFNSKRNSPLPHISASLDSPAELSIRISAEEPRKMIKRLKNSSNYEQFQNTYMRRFVKENKLKADLNTRQSKEYPISFPDQRSSGVYQKVKGKIKLLKIDKKELRESDVQTNDLDYDFHLIYDDKGDENGLALRQAKMIEEIEKIMKTCN